jgi:hypothetical protein
MTCFGTLGVRKSRTFSVKTFFVRHKNKKASSKLEHYVDQQDLLLITVSRELQLELKRELEIQRERDLELQREREREWERLLTPRLPRPDALTRSNLSYHEENIVNEQDNRKIVFVYRWLDDTVSVYSIEADRRKPVCHCQIDSCVFRG